MDKRTYLCPMCGKTAEDDNPAYGTEDAIICFGDGEHLIILRREIEESKSEETEEECICPRCERIADVDDWVRDRALGIDAS